MASRREINSNGTYYAGFQLRYHLEPILAVSIHILCDNICLTSILSPIKYTVAEIVK